jgi:hypothetical protein
MHVEAGAAQQELRPTSRSPKEFGWQLCAIVMQTAHTIRTPRILGVVARAMPVSDLCAVLMAQQVLLLTAAQPDV